ncbi:hypothetical protein G9464_02425 [Halostella sp. JP-L12]|uniref:HalOD1 output domain-containing protein n=1 Tax=Halostella TaxID=1843185 RepID=UPI000EF83735|nr:MULTISPECIES: HalOD1 output domain-containing protein [Halostella]NHN46458.1 hypothetical protein [Halostella sp. JP-L12]
MGTSEREEHDLYYPGEDKKLSTAVLETIQKQTDKDITKADFHLYDDIDPDALDSLFRKESTAETSVQFNTDDVTVTLWGDGAVAIQVTPRTDE